MKSNPNHHRWMALAFLAAMGAYRQAIAQQRYVTPSEPQLATLDISQASVGVYTEGNYEQTTFKNSGTSVTQNRIFAGPELDLTLKGSVYHPNLFSYQVSSEGAAGWSSEKTSSPNGSFTRNEFDYLGRFQANAQIFADKPLHVDLFDTYSHTFRDYDFFNRATADTWNTGGSLTYHTDPFFVSASYLHRDETVSGANIDSVLSEDVFGLAMRNDRAQGASALNYTFDQYNRTDSGMNFLGSNNSLSASDSERFGEREQYRTTTTLAYTHHEDDTVTPLGSDQISAATGLQVEHRENLHSSFDINYDYYHEGDYSSADYRGQAQVSHKLYESLTSALLAEASDSEGSSGASTGQTLRYGAGLTESYSKDLGNSHHLQINNSFLLEHVHQQTLNIVEDERHSFSDTLGAPINSFFLNQPNIIQATIVITDAERMRTFTESLDYIVIENGERTLIQRVAGSTMPDAVLVNYRAEPTPGGDYDDFTDYFEVRFDLYDNLWGIYGRFGASLNNAPKDMLIQNLKTYTFGTDVNWRWLHAGAEYNIYDSDLSRYNSTRLYQSLVFTPDPLSTLSFNFSETWNDYIDSHRKDQDYRFITRYHYNWTSHLALDLEGGVDYRIGDGEDQTLATIRPGLEYTIGKTSIKAGYDYEYSLFLNNQQRQTHLFYARLKRSF